ncbi:MAG: hypothetical protein P1U70_27850, partial [Saprospiraceae bacterium]|nr:hypothetical protein [Saprospiraceae bacterium]
SNDKTITSSFYEWLFWCYTSLKSLAEALLRLRFLPRLSSKYLIQKWELIISTLPIMNYGFIRNK